MSTDAETIYERVAKLEDEIALLRSELDIIKRAFRNKIARQTDSRGSQCTGMLAARCCSAIRW